MRRSDNWVPQKTLLSLAVGHWHNDMPGLSPSSQVLAFSAVCPRQIVKYTDLVYGFQRHMELNSGVAELLIKAETDPLHKSQAHKFVQTPDQIDSYDYTEMNKNYFNFLIIWKLPISIRKIAYKRNRTSKEFNDAVDINCNLSLPHILIWLN